MKLLVVRHAIAEPFSSALRSDADRALTDEGRRRMRRGAKALRQLVPDLALVATSPLVRAVQTAEILAEAYDGLPSLELGLLRPGVDLPGLADWLATRRGDATVAIVGHEPDLSCAVTWFATGRADSCVAMGKGGAALLEFPAGIGGARGVLLWLLRPGQLRSL